MTADIHALTCAYVLNAIPALERAAFERHLADCEPCAQEVRELQATATRLGEAASEQPPAALKAQVLNQIRTIRQAPPPGGNTRQTTTRWPTRLFGAAAAVLLVVSVALGVVLARNISDLDASKQQAAAMTELLSAEDTHIVSGSTTAGLKGTVVVSRQRGQVMLLANDVPKAPDGKTYQVWLIGSDFRSIGVFDPDFTGRASVVDTPGIRDATAIGITVEPDGGSPQPTTTPIMQMTIPA